MTKNLEKSKNAGELPTGNKNLMTLKVSNSHCSIIATFAIFHLHAIKNVFSKRFWLLLL